MKDKFKVQNSKLKAAFFTLLLLFLFTCNAVAADKIIGVIMTGDISYYSDVHDAFTARLVRKGYAEKVEILIQKPYPDPISLSNAARKLIAIDVDVIVTYGAPATDAVLREQTEIPIVYSCVYEPCNFKQPRNVTGTCSKTHVSSLLRYLRAITAISTLGVIYNSDEADSLQQGLELNRFSNQFGFKIEGINLKNPKDLKQMLSAKKMDALFITNSTTSGRAFPAILSFSLENKIPTATFLSGKNQYATITLSPASKEQGEKAAEKVISIFEGIPPDKIKVDTSSETELIFNLKEANSMGLKIPMELVTEATRLIQ
ncbi:MAG: hypothetical protein HZB30_09630 [Nitrospirae bacterium]|nr:hypothetical protein [Nitrospirota bacterium]